MKRAEVLAEGGDAESCVGSMYGEAMAAYAKACSLSSSEDGDDLPGLLHNWGVGLHSLGTHARVRCRQTLTGLSRMWQRASSLGFDANVSKLTTKLLRKSVALLRYCEQIGAGARLV